MNELPSRFYAGSKGASRKKGQHNQTEKFHAKIDKSKFTKKRASRAETEPAAAYIGGVSVPTMHRLIKRGLLKPNRSTRHLLFPVAELERFLRDGMT